MTLGRLICLGGHYTWSNNQINPTLEKLDRFLMSSDWEDLFPLTTIHKIAREVSDHNPIILDTMESRDVKKRHSDLKRAG
jgi:exonuclease III